MRPLFPKNMINNIVVSVTPLVIDKTQDLSILSLIGGSLSVLMAGIPFAGPIGAVRIGRVDEKFIINPTLDQMKA
jgi:polyribonucleotide nucleotidyltransferase